MRHKHSVMSAGEWPEQVSWEGPDIPTCAVKGKGSSGRAWGSGRGSLGLQALGLLIPTDLVCDQGGLISHHTEGLFHPFSSSSSSHPLPSLCSQLMTPLTSGRK